MSNLSSCDKSLLELDPETVAHLPRSFQLMIEIERQAQAQVNTILKDVRDGKTTLDEIKRARGI